MEYHKQVIIYIVLTSLLKVDATETTNERGHYSIDDRWTWGFAEQLNTNNTSDSVVTTEAPKFTTPSYNPCTLPPIPEPEFNVPGRRISMSKCIENIWDISRQEELSKRYELCRLYQMQQGAEPPAVIGGFVALPGEYPHMAALGWVSTSGGWIFLCGGTLISDRFVLTAAHCTKAAPSDSRLEDTVPKLVVLGETNIKEAKTLFLPGSHGISKIIVHPKYKSPKKYYDIALLELERTVYFDLSIRPACLWGDYHSLVGVCPTLTGWGVQESGGWETSPDLRVGRVDLIDSATCDRLLRHRRNRHWRGLKDNQLCAGKLAGGVDSCQGDSGGPLQVKIKLPTQTGSMYYVTGVTSFGFGCALAESPGVYTRVSAFIDWIEDIVWNKANLSDYNWKILNLTE